MCFYKSDAKSLRKQRHKRFQDGAILYKNTATEVAHNFVEMFSKYERIRMCMMVTHCTG